MLHEALSAIKKFVILCIGKKDAHDKIRFTTRKGQDYWICMATPAPSCLTLFYDSRSRPVCQVKSRQQCYFSVANGIFNSRHTKSCSATYDRWLYQCDEHYISAETNSGVAKTL